MLHVCTELQPTFRISTSVETTEFAQGVVPLFSTTMSDVDAKIKDIILHLFTEK